jgi:hypothetical protein
VFDRISKDLGLETPVDAKKNKFLILFFLDEKPCARCINEMFEYIAAADSIEQLYSKDIDITKFAYIIGVEEYKSKRFGELLRVDNSYSFINKDAKNDILINALENWTLKSFLGNQIIVVDLKKRIIAGRITVLNVTTESFRKLNLFTEILF